MPNLSDDMFEEILSRLPVKSLCRFKCVSKSWLHLIETQLNRTQKHKVIFGTTASLSSLDPEAAIDDDNMPPSSLDFPLKGKPGTRLKMVGLSNGLACIMPQPDALFIFNPSTGESMRVPERVLTKKKKNRKSAVLYGFGYAPSIKDYRMVKIFLDDGVVLMFSLTNKSWKRVEDIPDEYDLSSWRKWDPLNGAFHWLLEDMGDEDPPFIAAFDLADGKFSDLPLPESFDRDYNDFTTGIFGGCLCLLEQLNPFGFEFSCWVMEKYGVKESWTRIKFLAHSSGYFIDVRPICYWKKTKELLAIINFCHLVRLTNPTDGTYYVGPVNRDRFDHPIYLSGVILIHLGIPVLIALDDIDLT
ncbi:F-box/kelch-repeat protein At3g06240-like [Rosa rugosa]|uniref:F-box/kelch-repeat protein At3g06240-like n=1 Tax=Rosa rugosa TaxID=74645 RepID=UPI002B40367C|nr:F-box/kelch-repeat protein At3g06240-like [Rosa rugosa]